MAVRLHNHISTRTRYLLTSKDDLLMNIKQLEKLLKTKTAKEIFGEDKDKVFRDLSFICHPDRTGNADIFLLLNKKFDELIEKKTVITSKKRSYSIAAVFAEGDRSTLYMTDNMILKITRSPKTKLTAEREFVKATYNDTESPKLHHYYDNLIDSFTLPDGRSCDVFPIDPDLVGLEQLKEKFPNGIDPKHIAWIFKRILSGVGFAHKVGFLHCGILPSHILICPKDHGALFVGLNNAMKIGEKMTSISPKYENMYPPEVLKKEEQDKSLDIYMAAKTCIWLLGDRLGEERKLKIFLEGLTLPNPKRRIDDAWGVHWHWDELLRKVFGEPKFQKLEV